MEAINERQKEKEKGKTKASYKVVAVVASISQEITSATLIYTNPPPTAAAAA
jgi:hypothetical protein